MRADPLAGDTRIVNSTCAWVGDDGTIYSDFMVLIPGMRDLPKAEFADRVAGLQAVLGHYDQVVFADLNVRLNLLWVTVTPELGLIPDLVSALRQRLPEVRLCL